MKAFFNAPEKSSGSLVEVKQSALQPHEDFLVRSFVAAGFHGEDTVPYRLAACSIFFCLTASEARPTVFYGT